MVLPAIKLSTVEKDEALVATGDIHLWSCDTHEFFNDCHNNSDGKFCGGGGGGSGGGGGKGKDGSQKRENASKEDIKKDEEASKKAVAIGKKIFGDDNIKAPTKQENETGWAAVGAFVAVNLIGTAVYMEVSGGVPVLSIAAGETVGKYQARRAASKLAGKPIAKGIYKVSAKNGKVLHLHNHSEKLTEKQHSLLLKGFKETYDNDPIPGDAPILNVWEDPPGPNAPTTVRGWYRFGKNPPSKEINVARSYLFDIESQRSTMSHMPYGGRRYSMPAGKNLNAKYTIAHEYGHMRDNHYQWIDEEKEGFDGVREYGRKRDIAHTSPNIESDWLGVRNNGLSDYGKYGGGFFGGAHEGYAEAYAEWSMSGGKSGNKAAQYYAKQFNWKVDSSPGISARVIPDTPAPSFILGDKIARTPEGARRYGVSIGDKIPIIKAANKEAVKVATIQLVVLNSEAGAKNYGS